MRIANNVEMLEIASDYGICHPVLIWDQDNVVLVDTSYPLQISQIESAVQAAGFELSQINKLILTHQDIDHIGTVKEILAEAPNCQVLASAVEAPYIDGRKTPTKVATFEANYEQLSAEMKSFYNMIKPAFENRRIQIDQTVTEGEVLPICGGIEIVATPGHTPGHISLFLKEDKILIAGDALNIVDGTLNCSNPLFTWDVPQAQQSVAILQQYPVKQIIAFHGGLYQGNPEEALTAIVQAN